MSEEVIEGQDEGTSTEEPSFNPDILTGNVVPVKHPSGIFYVGAEVEKDGEKMHLPQGIQAENGLQPFYYLSEKDAKKQCRVYEKLIKWQKEQQKARTIARALDNNPEILEKS